MIKLITIYFFLLFSLSSHCQFLDSNCVGDGRIYFMHLRGSELIQQTLKVISNPTDKDFELLSSALKRYFKIDLSQTHSKEELNFLFSNIRKIASKIHKTKYFCDIEDESYWCDSGNATASTMINKKMYLCSPFFSITQREQQIGLLIHQWFHLYNYWKMDSDGEVLCKNASEYPSEVLIKQPDQYKLLIYYVGSKGTELGCI